MSDILPPKVEEAIGEYGSSERRWAVGDGNAWKPARDRALTALRAAILAAMRVEGERVLAVVLAAVNADKQSMAVARDRAAAGGRDITSLCRQSDVETCERLEERIRALLREGEPADAEKGGDDRG